MRISDWSSDVCSSDLAGRPDHPGEAEAVGRKRGRMNIDMPAGDRAVVQHPHSRNVAVDKAQLDLLARHDIVAEAGFAGGHQSLEVERPGAAGRNATKEPPVRAGRDRKSTRLNSSH